MATVDSSVGGKTGVNHPLGKNMIGAFYQPQCVLVDTATLHTLPDRELASGLSEIVKYGLIYDAALFAWLEQNMQRLLGRDEQVPYPKPWTSENVASYIPLARCTAQRLHHMQLPGSSGQKSGVIAIQASSWMLILAAGAGMDGLHNLRH